MKLNVHFLQHHPNESAGYIEDWVNEHQHRQTYTLLYDEWAFPTPKDIDILVVLGGEMSVYEEHLHDWMPQQKQFIRQCIDAGKVVLGICLGAQFVAEALGAKVYKHTHQEIGIMPIEIIDRTFGGILDNPLHTPMQVFHWHGDTFDLPTKATFIASSIGCKNQAFAVGKNILALQFHLEMNEPIIEAMMSEGLPHRDRFVQTADEIRSKISRLHDNRVAMFRIMDGLVKRNFLR